MANTNIAKSVAKKLQKIYLELKSDKNVNLEHILKAKNKKLS